MRLFDFTLNLLSHSVEAGGVGLVAVDLLHKKEHVAKDLISYFLSHYHQQGAVMAMLYPFRPDFYKQMGFGFGTKMNHYRIKPAQLPSGLSKQHVRRLTEADAPQMLACYQQYSAATHGMIERAQSNISHLLNHADYTVVGYEHDQRIEGYLVFSFKPAKPDNFLLNDLHVEECIYLHHSAYAELLAFLRSQSDQFNSVVINTQDEYFHHMLHDPRNGSNNVFPHVFHESNAQGVGIMYRVLDTPRLFEALHDHNFGDQSLTVQLAIRDTFFPNNQKTTTVQFVDGRPTIREGIHPDVMIELDVAEFSSLVVGTVPFRQLYTYGLAQISDANYVSVIDSLFAVREKPVCVTRF
jgi:predicted acetyltransferase